MNRLIDHGKLWLLGLFLVASAATIAYQAWYVWPMERCERAGAWWSSKYHQCDIPIPVWRFTGRLPTPPQARTGPSARTVQPAG